MCAFSVIDKAPGVYIQEIKGLGPIAGVGTSTAAFVGVARSGPTGTPVRLANWNEFVEKFGKPDDLGAYLPTPQFQVTSAVAGFFTNGGSDCWFVRVGSAKRAFKELKDGGGSVTLVVDSKIEGADGNKITVVVKRVSSRTTAATREATTLAAASAKDTNEVQVPTAADAKRFRVGDWIVIEDGNKSERAEIKRIAGVTLTFETPLTKDHAAAIALRIADLDVGQRSFRVEDVADVEPGSAIKLTQGALTETNVISKVDQAVGESTGLLTLDRPVATAFALDAAAVPVTVATQEFTLVVGGTETYPKLSIDPRHSHYFGTAVDSPKVIVRLADNPPNSALPPDNLPVAVTTTLADGTNDNPFEVTANAYKAGIDALRAIDEVNMLCVPDRTDQDVQVHMISHCTTLADRFAILDPQPRADSAQITVQRESLGSDRGYAALYYPRIVISDPRAPGRLTIAPSGHVAGLYARVDNERGVFKAPANEALDGVLDLERQLADETQGPLNEDGINVIRRFPGRGVLVWGARTISEDTLWRYVNVRRLLLFIEESIQEGTQFVVFEPNTPALWEQVKLQVSEFLTRQWAAGALVGATAEDAFKVICDASLNPPASMALGQLVVEVRLYPAPPAEFVVFRIVQRPGGPEIQE